jgi:hypothetical protein
LLSDPVREAVASLVNVTAKLETITELVVGAKAQGRKRRRTPPEPTLDLEDVK